MKVLIADDSEEVRERMKMLISEICGVGAIGEAANVQQAIDHIRMQIPDVVILDIRMPGGNGIDVLRKIEKNKCLPVVIMLTNHPSSQYRRKCMDAGADFFFDKTREFEKVIEVLRGGIKGRASDLRAFSERREVRL